MIYFFFSNNLNNNLSRLHEKVKEERDNFFKEFNIIISSDNYKKCIEEYFLLKENVCINISFDFLEPFLSNIFLELLGYDKKDVIILTLERNKIILTSLIFSILKDENFRNRHSNIFDILLSNNEDNLSYETTLLWKLSETLTNLFREYEYHRLEEIIQRWKNMKNAYDEPNVENIEVFERDIYYQIFLEKKFFKNLNKKYFSISELFEEVIKNESQLNIDIFKKYKKIYLFGFSQFSKLHFKMLEFLEKYTEIYLFSPSYMKFDFKNFPYFVVNQNKEERFSSEHGFNEIDEFLYPLIATNYLLKDKINDKNLHIYWKEIQNDNVLNSLKRFFMNGEKSEEKREQDESLKIFSAASIENEVFAVYNSILYNMEKDKDLLFDDILLIVPNLKKYRSTIIDIFSKNPYQSHPSINKKEKIPFQIYEKNTFQESNFNKVLSTFFELIENNFSKFTLLKFIENPIVMKKFKIEANDLTIFRKWIEELGAYDEDEYFLISRTKQALKRLKLGLIMEKKSPEESFLFENNIPYNDNHNDIKTLDSFISIMEKIFIFMKESKVEKVLCEWIDFIKNFINEFIDTEEFDKENQIRKFYLRNLDLLLELNLIIRKKLNFTEIKFHFLNLMADLLEKNSYLFNGVCVSSFLPMRAIPFKIIYILGMNEGEFPSEEDKSSLNLRNKRLSYNDISKRRLDNYLFIEAIFSAEKKIYISYVGYEAAEDCELFPSGTVYNLINILNKNILKNEYEIKKLPKNLFSKKLLKKEDLLTNIYFTPYRKLSYEYGKETSNKRTIEQKFSKFEINIKSLAKFIQNPIEEMIKQKIGIYEPEQIELSRTRKISSKIQLKTRMLSMALRISFLKQKSFKESFEQVYNYFYYSGKTVEIMVLKEIEIKDISFVEEILKKLPAKNYYESLIIGNEYQTQNRKIFPSLEINKYKIIGKLENAFIEENKIILPIFKSSKKNIDIKNDRNYIMLKLFLSALNMLDKNINEAILKIIYLEDKIEEDESLKPLDQKDFLAIIDYYTKDENFHLIPIEILKKINTRAEILTQIKEKEKEEFTNFKLPTVLLLKREYDDFIPENEELQKYKEILLKIEE